MAMVELRWVRSSKPTTDPDRLQYRAYLPLANGPYRHGDWGKWQDVPLVIVDEPTRDRRCPYCAGVIYTDAGRKNCKLGSAHNPSSGEMT